MDIERKPVITYAGDEHVFRQLQNGLVHSIPQEQIQWRRGQDQTPILVTLDATFEPFDPARIVGADEASVDADAVDNTGRRLEDSLKRCECLHTYWMDATDMDSYKQTGREPLLCWRETLKQHGVADWLVVVVETGCVRAKTNKLLARATGSLYDRVKHDVQAKHGDRCISLADPVRADARSADSLQALIARLRQLLLAGVARALSRFQTSLQAHSDARATAGWSVTRHCLLLEELAITLQQLAVPAVEYLVLYDRLDTLLTDVITTATDGVMAAFSRPVVQWPAVCLTDDSWLDDVRRQIVDNDVSYFDFRNYIFARQCALLRQAQRHNELASRAGAMLLTSLQHLQHCSVDIPPGGVQCWAFNTCMNVIDACNAHQPEPTVHMATLYDLARCQLYRVGELCGLLPEPIADIDNPATSQHHTNTTPSTGPSSQQLHVAVTLSSGSGDGGGDGRLARALSSSRQLCALYVELTELATGTFKHTGRLRQARAIGCQLAEFQLRLDRAAHAASLLADAMAACRREGWLPLAEQCGRRLLLCYRRTGELNRYIQTCIALIECDQTATSGHDPRSEFIDLLAEAITGDMGSMTSAVTDVSPTFESSIDGLCKVETSSVVAVTHAEYSEHSLVEPASSNSKYAVLARLNVQTENLSRISINVRQCYVDVYRSAPAADLNHHSVVGDVGVLDTPIFATSLEYRRDKSLHSAALVCRNISTVLRRRSSVPLCPPSSGGVSGGVSSATSHATTDNTTPAYRLAACGRDASDIRVVPGTNRLQLETAIDCEGDYVVSQLTLVTDSVQLVVPLRTPVRFSVKFQPLKVELVNTENVLVSGIAQQMSLIVTCGTMPLSDGGCVQLVCSGGLSVQSAADVSSCSDNSWATRARVSVPSLLPRQSTNIAVSLFSELTFDKSSVEHTVKIVGVDKVEVQWKHAVTFYMPFTVTHKLHTADTRKFLQVHVCGSRWCCIQLSNVGLCVSHESPAGTELLSFNDRLSAHQMIVSEMTDTSFVWQLVLPPSGDNSNHSDRLKLIFEADYAQAAADSSASAGRSQMSAQRAVQRRLKMSFVLADFTTVFSVRCCVEATGGAQVCRAGALCRLVVSIQQHQHQSAATAAVMYEVLVDQHAWAVCGANSGVITVEGAARQHIVHVEVMALVPGALCIPSVRLSKYIQAQRDGAGGGGGDVMPRLLPFSTGQVYNSSRNLRVDVARAHTSTTTTTITTAAAKNSVAATTATTAGNVS